MIGFGQNLMETHSCANRRVYIVPMNNPLYNYTFIYTQLLNSQRKVQQFDPLPLPHIVVCVPHEGKAQATVRIAGSE